MILETKGLCKSFGHLQALLNVNMVVEQGEILGVAGPNGAGKSTLFNVIAGLYPPTAGSISFEGRSVTGLKSHHICQRGLARTFQVPKTFKTLSVYDNIRVGATFGRQESKNLEHAIDETISFLGLDEHRRTEASHLDLYTTKMVMLAACLATKCRTLLLDEPLAGLAMNEVENYLAVVRKINTDGGVTVIIIEHILDSLFSIADRMVILNYGQVIFTGLPEDVAKDENVVECYLGNEEIY